MKIRRRDFYDKAEAAMLTAADQQLEQPAFELSHEFSDGIYMRSLKMPAGTLAIGHQHRTKHFNLLLAGTVTITGSDGTALTRSAPCAFESNAGCRKIAFAHTEVILASVHPNPDNCRNVSVLENRFVTKSKA